MRIHVGRTTWIRNPLIFWMGVGKTRLKDFMWTRRLFGDASNWRVFTLNLYENCPLLWALDNQSSPATTCDNNNIQYHFSWFLFIFGFVYRFAFITNTLIWLTISWQTFDLILSSYHTHSLVEIHFFHLAFNWQNFQRNEVMDIIKWGLYFPPQV